MPVLCTPSCTDRATHRASHGHTRHNAEELKVFITEISVYIDNYSIVIRDKQHGLCQVNSNVVCSLLMKKEEIAEITLERNAFHFYQVQRPFFPPDRQQTDKTNISNPC